jgi:hypothetical protein
MVSFLQVANAVTNLEPSNHWIHESTLAKRLGLGISIDDLEGWVKCVREGGSGAVSDNTFVANPASYNVKIDLSDLSADNSLNLHYQDKKCYTSPMRDLIESFGTEITAHARYQMTEKRDLTTTYLTEYIPPSDDDSELAG